MNNNLQIAAIIVFISCFVVSELAAQIGPPKTKAEFEKMFKRRSRKTYLYGVYIPKDMGEAFNELDKKIDDDSKKKYMSLPEEVAARKLHFSLGRWLMVNWSFYEGSRYAKYLRDIGITHPDDMAYFTMILYHRHLNKKPLDVKPLVLGIKEKRKKEALERRAKGKVLHEEKRIRPRN